MRNEKSIVEIKIKTESENTAASVKKSLYQELINRDIHSQYVVVDGCYVVAVFTDEIYTGKPVEGNLEIFIDLIKYHALKLNDGKQ
ncbi:TPA: hypothetical protein U2J52_003314 [Providencia rettgeri]|uniref:hypothetical protein n=1 Tax=unclassified Providencia TaxID=2633465 RepID=UPI002349755D|nr:MULTISPECIES: hypothetical protein [unclassified Providencia]HEM7527075.1 hypothetical protein [Providencia rettgeri]